MRLTSRGYNSSKSRADPDRKRHTTRPPRAAAARRAERHLPGASLGIFSLNAGAPYSSGAAFDGWRIEVGGPSFIVPVSRARTWLLTRGWRRHGLLDPSETPGPTPTSPIAGVS